MTMSAILHLLSSPLMFLADPDRRLFWAYLVASAVTAIVFLYFQPKHWSALKAWKSHKKSIFLDFKILVFNSLFSGLIKSFGFVSQFALVVAIQSFLRDQFGSVSLPSAYFDVFVLLASVVSFLLFDFLRFFQHFLMHKIPFLWSFHKVHHSATYLTPVTLYRMHPMENLVSDFRKTLGRGLAFGGLSYLFSYQMDIYSLFGVNAFAFTFNLLAVNLRHSPLPLSFGKLEHFFMSPAQHQLHHSNSPDHWGKNLGVNISLWDKLFGTFLPHEFNHSYKFGLSDGSKHTILDQILKPFLSKELFNMYKYISIFVFSFYFLTAKGSQSTVASYEFQSRFDGKSSVSYSGQVFRQILIDDLKISMGEYPREGYPGGKSEAIEGLWSYVDYDHDGPSDSLTSISRDSEYAVKVTGAHGEPVTVKEGYTYGDITSSAKQLLEKIAGNDNPLRHKQFLGWNSQMIDGTFLLEVDVDGKADDFVEPEDLLYALLVMTAENSTENSHFFVENGSHRSQKVTEAYITEEALDTRQLAQKLLHGSLSFSQATGDYLSTDLGTSKGLNVDNNKVAKSGVNYTALEHHWDEAFGYFGGAVNYLDYDDDQLKAGYSIDNDEDQRISLLSEKNYGISIAAAKRDLGSTQPKTDYTKKLFHLFYDGRKMITTQSADLETKLPVIAKSIAQTWEEVIAATVVHYINETIQQTELAGQEKYTFKAHAKYWSEMKGYALAFQFNPHSLLGRDEFVNLHDLLQDKPALLKDGQAALTKYVEQLKKARALLAKTYNFSPENTENW